MKPVAELLKKRDYTEVYSVGPTATVFEAITLLAEKGVGALMVMEGEKLAGIFSERDYTRKIAIVGRNSRETLVSEIMTTPVLFVTPTQEYPPPPGTRRWQGRRHAVDTRSYERHHRGS